MVISLYRVIIKYVNIRLIISLAHSGELNRYKQSARYGVSSQILQLSNKHNRLVPTKTEPECIFYRIEMGPRLSPLSTDQGANSWSHYLILMGRL